LTFPLLDTDCNADHHQNLILDLVPRLTPPKITSKSIHNFSELPNRQTDKQPDTEHTVVPNIFRQR